MSAEQIRIWALVNKATWYNSTMKTCCLFSCFILLTKNHNSHLKGNKRQCILQSNLTNHSSGNKELGCPQCAGLNEKNSCKLICLDTWSSVGRTLWKRLRGVTFLEEGWPKSSQKPEQFLVSSLCVPDACEWSVSLQLLLQDHVCLPAAMLSIMMVMDCNPQELWAPVQLFLH